MDYGSDELYMSMMEEAFATWDLWNREWPEPLYHQSGFLLLAQFEMKPDDFEYESLKLLRKRGHGVVLADRQVLQRRFPAWKAEEYASGYFNPRAGWAESGRVVERLAAEAVRAGVHAVPNVSAVRLGEDSSRNPQVVGSDGNGYHADTLVLATGAWSQLLSPRLAEVMAYVAQPVFHFRVRDPERFRGPAFPPWAADISKTGWYGFPANRDGIVKVANHGAGRVVHPDNPRATTAEEESACREFLRGSLPELGDAALASSRTCLYADSWDGNFYVCRDPERPNLVYATGDSGHGFKFAPILGKLVADVVEGKNNPYAGRFAWRDRGQVRVREQARYLV
jgi:glycine/D-amino acid oxidase-like deaminating enzyme